MAVLTAMGLVAPALLACGGSSEPVCGDGLKQGDEACDDGNTLDTDSCTNSCLEAACGDGILQLIAGETCDDGNADDGDGCSATCAAERCGDGVATGDEECDDGNTIDSDGCRNSCAEATCGDGVVQAGVEACDDGNQDDSDACSTACAPPSCGDEVVQPGTGEQCDDGNTDDSDACRTNCLAAVCGDGLVQDGVEQCDDGNLNDHDGCRNSCAIATCGDGVVQTDVEECDDANTIDFDSCSNACLQARCGDGVVQTVVGETCDDGNKDDSDACPGSCRTATCGDGFTHFGEEECDDGDTTDDDVCGNDCVANCFAGADSRYIDPATGSCYGVYSSSPNTWSNAEAACAAAYEDGHLVSIGSATEQALVVSLTNAFPLYIGFNDLDTEGEFEWTDGTAPEFTAWLNGEPNNLGGEDCTETNASGWNDSACGGARNWICEAQTLVLLPGVQQNLDPASLGGWTECYADTYDNSSTALADILAACSGDNLMLGCRPVGDSNLTLAAMAPRADVLFDCGSQNNCTNQANGVGWYFNDSYSWGFAPAGEPVNRSSCDFNDGAQTAADQRLCWHTSAGNIASGYRCGDNNLNGASGWQRVIYQAD
jgi:cysteine-rich repeat protein